MYLCNPQNPTGRVLPIDEVTALAGALRGGDGTTLIVDEAFLSVSTRWQDTRRPLPEAVVRVRSFTKEHGVPGLRLGAAIAPGGPRRIAWTPAVPAGRSARPRRRRWRCARAAEAEAHVADVRTRWREDTLALAE